MSVQFATILYANRSGSTFLSRILAESSPDLFVFPETSFLLDLIIDLKKGRIVGGVQLYSKIMADGRRDAIALSDRALLEVCERNTSADLQRLIVDIASMASGKAPVAIILKLSMLLYFVDDVKNVFDNMQFFHLIRDPRSVCSSMLASQIPEKPGFNMARGSVLYAAREWKNYIRTVLAVEKNTTVTWIRYDDLRDQSAWICSSVLDLLHVTAPVKCMDAPKSGYQIADLDHGLHPLVFNDFDDDRIQAWRRVLPFKSVSIIESTCGAEMSLLDFRLECPPLSRVHMIPVVFGHWLSVSINFVRTIAVYAQRSDRIEALKRRVNFGIDIALRSQAILAGNRSHDSSDKKQFVAGTSGILREIRSGA